MSGNSLCGQIFVRSNGFQRKALRLLVGHDLDLQRPPGIVAPVECLYQVTLRPVGIRAAHGEGFGMREVFNALERLEVEFHPDALLLALRSENVWLPKPCM